MTDRHAAYLVVLDDDYREDEAGQHILNAIRMVKGVRSVQPVLSDYEHVIARERRDGAWKDALRQLAREGPGT